jgi:acetyltransferase-like isoleucine patch superfamily enzyme
MVTEVNSVIELGRNVWLAEDCVIESSGTVRVGAGTTIQRRTSLIGSVEIGQNCILAPNIFISSGSHPFRRWPHLAIRDQEQLMAERGELPDNSPVLVGDDCWLGVNVVVSPGISIGQGAVVGANSVVTKDVPPYAVVAGVPARLISRRLEWKPPASLDFTDPASTPYLSGADASVTEGKILTALATPNTVLHLADCGTPLDLMLEIEVLRPTIVEVNGVRHDLLSVGRSSIVITTKSGGPIRIGAALRAVRLIAFDPLK